MYCFKRNIYYMYLICLLLPTFFTYGFKNLCPISTKTLRRVWPPPCSAPVLYFSLGLLILGTIRYHHISLSIVYYKTVFYKTYSYFEKQPPIFIAYVNTNQITMYIIVNKKYFNIRQKCFCIRETLCKILFEYFF